MSKQMTAIVDRRTLLTVAGVGLAGLAAPIRLHAAPPSLVFGAQGGFDEGFWLTAFDADGRRSIEVPLPDRGHDTVIDPAHRHAVVIARRAGTFAMVIDLASGDLAQEIAAEPGRHFYGHGVFSPDGALLYTTENDYEAGDGRIGVRDARDGYRWLGELPSHGIGPHQIALLSDGETLVVANGGIRTHPAQGRRKLNVDTMDPSLVRLERASGKLVESRGLAPWLHQLSIRHIAVDRSDRIAVAMQHEGSVADRVPMVAIDRGQGELVLLRAPETVERQMRNYCGSVCLDSSEEIMAVSHPRGSQITFWSWPDGDYRGRLDVLDGCGLAPAGTPGRFWISNGRGELSLYDAREDRATAQRVAQHTERYWDNHLTVLR